MWSECPWVPTTRVTSPGATPCPARAPRGALASPRGPRCPRGWGPGPPPLGRSSPRKAGALGGWRPGPRPGEGQGSRSRRLARRHRPLRAPRSLAAAPPRVGVAGHQQRVSPGSGSVRTRPLMARDGSAERWGCGRLPSGSHTRPASAEWYLPRVSSYPLHA